MVEYGTVDPYWGGCGRERRYRCCRRSSRVWRCIFITGFAIDFGIEYPQGDVVLEYGTVYHYGGHCGRELCGISLLGTLW